MATLWRARSSEDPKHVAWASSTHSWTSNIWHRPIDSSRGAVRGRELGAEERVGVMPEEVSGVYFRSSRPLPKDDDFVSSFRRPLREEHQLRHL